MKLKVDYFSRMLLVLFCLALGNFSWAQRTITGTVTDADGGEPLIGANVLVVGTSTGTVTDFDGNYSLNVPDGANSLEYSYTGYATQRVAISASNVMDVTLSSGELLDEVVVVGYGTTTQKEVTSAVTSIKEEDFNKGAVQDPVQLIQGKIAGLSISKPGGNPNGSSTIRLRGLSTLGANTQPLVVVDGVIGATLESVDPNDIASIDVLKDGSAAAIYGSRASSGVILITTKKGGNTGGQTSIEYNGFVSSETIAKTIDRTDAAEFRRLLPNSDRGSNTDWVDEVTRNAISHVHNISASGGIGKTSYRASFNVRDVQGVSIASGFKQMNGRLNLTQKAFDDRLTLGLNVSATQRNAEYGFDEGLRYALLYNPTAPVRTTEADPLFDTYGGYYQEINFDYFNPVAILEQNINEGQLKDLLVSIRGDYELVDGLTASVSYSNLKEADLFGEYYSKNSFFRGINTNGFARRNSEDKVNELFEITGNYDLDLGSNNLKLLAGYSYNDITSENFSVQAGDFISDFTTFNNLNLANNIQASSALGGGKQNYKVIGFFGRANFSIDDTYYLSATVRHEGSSRFGPNNQWGTFPAFSAAVNLGNLVDLTGVDNLKLRLGWGQTGAIPPESYLSKFRFGRQGSFFFNGSFVPAYGPSVNDNPNLRWETKTEFDAGLDFAAFDYKLTGTFDYYDRTTNDLIFFVPVPVPPNQAGNTWANLEDVELKNQGVELSVGYRMEGDGFSWEPRVNFGTFSTRLDTVDVDADAQFQFFQSADPISFDPQTSPGAPGQNNLPTIAVIGGEELGQIWGFQYDGLDENNAFKFVDQNGDGAIDDNDKTVIGNGLPSFSLGFANTFQFGNVDFNFFLRGDFGHDLINLYRNFYEPINNRGIEQLVTTEFFDENLTSTPGFNSYYVEDASYVTLDNATLGYTLDMGDGGAFNKARIYVSGQNLFTITNYTGADPSVRYADPGASDNGGRPSREFNPSPLAPGIDRRNTYFRTRSVTLGVNLGF